MAEVGGTPGSLWSPWGSPQHPHAGTKPGTELAHRPGLSRSRRWWEGKRRESEGGEKKKKKLTQKPQGIFCLFRILGREKIATVIQSIPDNHSLFTVCMQRWQAGSAARGRGMRNSPGSLRPLLLGPKKPSAAVPHSSTGGGGERPGAGEEGEAPGSGGTGAGQSWRGGESFIPAGPRSKPGLEMEPMARSARLVC